MQIDSVLKRFEGTGNGLRRTLQDSIVEEISMSPDPNWAYLLSHFDNSFRQLSDLWKDMDPEFQLYLPIPSKPPACPTDTPQFLSTKIAPEENEAIIASILPVEEEKLFISSKSCPQRPLSEEQLQSIVMKHNQDMKSVLEKYQALAEQKMGRPSKFSRTSKELNESEMNDILTGFH